MLDSMGAIAHRRNEQLGTSDTAIIVARLRLLKAARDLRRGLEPAAAHRGELYGVRSLDVVARQDNLDALLEAYETALAAHV